MSIARRLLLPAAAGALGLVLALLAWETGAANRFENDTVDARFSLRDDKPSRDLVIVAVDDDSIENLGSWPFSRRHHARAVERLHAAGARLIVYDVQFTEASPDPAADAALFDAVAEADGVVLATSTSDDQGRTDVLGGDENLNAIGARAGAANLLAEEGGIVRRYEREVGALPSLAVVAAEELGRGDVSPERFPDGRAWIDYRGGPGTFLTVPFLDVVRGRVAPAALRDRIVMVGATSPSLQDLHPTPAAEDREMSGVEIHANALSTALRGNPLRDAPGGINTLALVLLAFVPPLTMAGRRFLTTVGFAIAIAVAFCVLAGLLFAGGVVLRVTPPLMALGLSTGAAVVGGALLEGRERQRALGSLEEAYREIVRRLAFAVESRDYETGEHLERLSQLVQRLASAAGMSPAEAEMLRHASVMHDVGKIGLPDHVLHKPGRLTDEEWAVMRRHTVEGSTILAGSESPLVQLAEKIARTHHEKWDGTGYPQGLKGEEIPLEGRITAVCDVFDALVSARHYKPAWPLDEALAEIKRQRGKHFDPQLVDRFLEIVEDLPPWMVAGNPRPDVDGAG